MIDHVNEVEQGAVSALSLALSLSRALSFPSSESELLLVSIEIEKVVRGEAAI
jgi:hypothetical protein